MGEYTQYILGAYGITLIVLIGNVLWSINARKKAMKEIN